jgi:hypothetical protein
MSTCAGGLNELNWIYTPVKEKCNLLNRERFAIMGQERCPPLQCGSRMRGAMSSLGRIADLTPKFVVYNT